MAGASIFACFLFLIHHQASAERILGRAVQAEQVHVRANSALHETLRLDIQSNDQRSPGQLDIWTEPASQRYAWKWKDSARHIRFAEWHPAPKQRYVLDGGSAHPVLSNVQVPKPPVLLVEMCQPSASLDQLNAAFADWVQSHQWRLISLARDFASFSDRAGTTLSIRRVLPPQGRSKLELFARRVDGSKQSTLTLEIDESTGRPLAETARVSSARGLAVLHISVDRVEEVEARFIPAAVFRPGITLEKNQLPGHAVEKKLHNTPHAGLSVDRRSLEEAEVELMYALHKAGLCRGTPLTLNLDLRSRKVLLDGSVESAELKQQIGSAIQSLDIAGMVRNNVRTAAETQTLFQPQASPVIPPASDVLDAAPLLLPIEALIGASGQSDADRSRLKQEVADRASRLLSAVERLTGEAWEIHHLALRFAQLTSEPLSSNTRYLISTMTRDHRTALEQSLSEVEALLSPFRRLAKQPPLEVKGVDAASNDDTRALLEIAKRINNSARALFALGKPLESDPNQSAAELFEALSQFRPLLGRCDQPNRFLSTTEVDHNVHYPNPETCR
jgi:hypothetical protein